MGLKVKEKYMTFDNKSRTYHRSKDIVVKTTGHDWDFAAYVENLNNRPITIHFTGDDFDDNDDIHLDSHGEEYDWMGFFLSEYSLFRALRNREYEVIYG